MRASLERRVKPSWKCVKYIVFDENEELSKTYNCIMYIPKALDNRLKGDAKKREDIKALYQQMLERAGWTRREFKKDFGRSYI